MAASIFLSAIVACVIIWATRRLSADDPEGSSYRKTHEQTGFAIFIGLLVGAMNYVLTILSGKAVAYAPLILLQMVILYIALGREWSRDGDEWGEMIPFVVLAVLFYFPTQAAAWKTTSLWDNEFLTDVVGTALPIMILVATIGYFVIRRFYFYYKEYYAVLSTDTRAVAREKQEKAAMNHTWYIIALILTILALLTILFLDVDWSKFGLSGLATKADVSMTTEEPTEEEPVEEPVEEEVGPWFAFYNTALIDNDDPLDDYNFGYNPREYHPEWEKAKDAPRLFDADFRERMTGTEEKGKGADVALGTAAMAWVDANVGTRYLGTFYESCKGDWAKTMNEAKVKFMADQELYQKTLKAFFAFLDSAGVDVRKASDMDDQMYMNSYTVDGVPDIVVYKTNDHQGLFLVYTFTIKGQKQEVSFRIDCGYQPTNVEKVMAITPQSNPTKKEEPKPSTPTGGGNKPSGGGGGGDQPSGGGDKPSGGGDKPDGNGKKDPSQGTQGDPVKPNDNPGPGPDTNNGKGAKESTEDLPTNSNHETMEEYHEDMDGLEDVSAHQKTDRDSDKPSTKIEGTETNPVTTDNHGDDFDDTMPVAPRITNSEDDRPITNEPSNPGGQWEGPPD